MLSLGQNVHIYIDKNLPPDWERYITVKELCHLILTDPEYMTEEPTELLELMIHEETTPKDGEAPLDLVVDMSGKMGSVRASISFRVSRERRNKIVNSNTATLFSSAEAYEIPEHVVDWVLTDRHMETCKQAWEQVSN